MIILLVLLYLRKEEYHNKPNIIFKWHFFGNSVFKNIIE